MSVRLLDDHVINQIAAGEVVERPASVVKELVENALDAGASRVEVSLKDGGRVLVRVRDNGSGMSRQDAVMCIERHATSKITTAEDLNAVETLGFRGEAIPSIASICEFELVTRTAADEAGTQIIMSGGVLVNVAQAGCPVGTDILVRDIFGKVPARRKFLRTRSTELAHCMEAVLRVAVLRTDVNFALQHQGRDSLRVSACEEWSERVSALLGEPRASLVSVDTHREGMGLKALLAPTNAHRSSAKAGLYLYVNGRYVRDPVVRKAVAQAYRDRLPRGRYPVAVVHVHVPPGEVDVNVHPSKTEVRFVNPRAVMAFVTESLESALGAPAAGPAPAHRSRAYEHPTTKLPFGPRYGSSGAGEPGMPEPKPSIPAHPDDDAKLAARPVPASSVAADREGPSYGLPQANLKATAPPTPGPLAQRPAPAAQEQPKPTVRSGRDPSSKRRVLGAFLERYGLCEDERGLLIVDVFRVRQALGERQLDRDRGGFLGESSPLLMPITVDLPGPLPGDGSAVFDEIGRVGFDLTLIDPRLAVVRRVPRIATDAPIEDWALALIEVALRPGDKDSDALGSELCRLWACREQPLDAYALRSVLADAEEVGLDLGANGFGARVSSEELAQLIRQGGV
jgi:DNA mismatch repair protein MutL